MTYELCYMVWTKLKLILHLKNVLSQMTRGDSKEYVMHGSNIQGIVNMIKRDPKNLMTILFTKKEINHAIKVSWIKEPDHSTSLTDIMKRMVNRTMGGLVEQVRTCCNSQRKPDEVYLIGHDLHSATDKVNNLYKGTKHYVAPENGPTPV